MDQWVKWWVNGWGSCQITKYYINLGLIQKIKFCFMICGDTPTHGWVYAGVDEWVGKWNHVKSLKSNKF